ncbi:DUF6221 family protein [Streptomyces sp. NPDC005969]|uniref:DUF6221 family protein n=1 Tax=Streptomyces sp. NPDC005969 TaxID=3156722 RepID=UPI0033E81644
MRQGSPPTSPATTRPASYARSRPSAAWSTLTCPPGADPHPGQPCVNHEDQDPAEHTRDKACSRHLAASERLLHHDYVLRLLALPYTDHPDYREDWRP